jgi:outer membrane protein assembly factor BamB
MIRTKFAWAVGVALSCATTSLYADWLQFRGNDHSGIADGAVLPTSFNDESKENVAWKVALPGKGASSPIVIGDKVIVTASGGTTDADRELKQDHIYVLCFDAKSGKELWRRKQWATGRSLSHPQSGNAAPTPASDGKRIFAFFSSNDVVCLDLDGNLLWYRGLAYDYPKAGNDIGMSSSPVVIGDTVIVQVESQGDSFAAGLNTSTGETRWRIERDPGSTWCSPAVYKGEDGKSAVLLQSSARLTAHEPATGKELWKFEASCNTIPSSTAQPGVIYVPASGLTALKIKPDSPNPEVQWDSNQLAPDSASPVIYKGKVYLMGRGVLTAGDAETGKKLWQLRLKGSQFWATPVIADDKMYLASFDKEGEAQIVDLAGSMGKVIGTGKLGEPVQASPAVSDNAMYIRSDHSLWKIAAKP